MSAQPIRRRHPFRPPTVRSSRPDNCKHGAARGCKAVPYVGRPTRSAPPRGGRYRRVIQRPNASYRRARVTAGAERVGHAAASRTRYERLSNMRARDALRSPGPTPFERARHRLLEQRAPADDGDRPPDARHRRVDELARQQRQVGVGQDQRRVIELAPLRLVDGRRVRDRQRAVQRRERERDERSPRAGTRRRASAAAVAAAATDSTTPWSPL